MANNTFFSYLQFKALQIPEPVDTQTNAINQQEAESVSDFHQANPCGA